MTQADWNILISHPIRQNRSVLSVYLDVDRSRPENLNRGLRKRLKILLAEARTTIRGAVQLERFSAVEKRVDAFLNVYRAGGQTLVLFYDDTDGFFWHGEVDVQIESVVRWGRECLLAPLVAATDDFERYAVILAARAHARVFTVFLGQIEEVAEERFDPRKVRHLKSTGTYHGNSVDHIERKADEQRRHNLRATIRRVESLAETAHVRRLILAGSPKLMAELKSLLPRHLAVLVIGSLNLDAEAPIHAVRDATLALAEKHERATEVDLVRALKTSSAKREQAVVGLRETLGKLRQGRVWQLAYSQNLHSSGVECTQCGALFAARPKTCGYWGGSMLRVPNLAERAVEQAVRRDVKVEVVRGEAAASLDAIGGIGAILKAVKGRLVRVEG